MSSVTTTIAKPSTANRRSMARRSRPRAAYELAAAQVQTPPAIVSLFWRLAHQRRRHFQRVLDLGAADGRFAKGGRYSSYDGIEIDPSWVPELRLPKKAHITIGCAFKFVDDQFDACIGNPPYVRHHDIESPWKARTAALLGDALGVSLRLDANLYLYFLALACIKSKPDGLVGLILPHEWTARPSAGPLREAIVANRWPVDVYRFQAPIFDGVLTTASITFIDKQKSNGIWRYFDIDRDFRVHTDSSCERRKRISLPYVDRSKIWARRGISPGVQSVFVLTETERVRWGLRRSDVLPAVTSLRSVPNDRAILTQAAFQEHFVRKGRRCWLIKTKNDIKSPVLKAYTRRVPPARRDTATCRRQSPWYAYEQLAPPPLIIHSCFTRASPKVLVNRLRAIPVGTAYGVYSNGHRAWHALRRYLSKYPFRRSVIPHARKLRKIEVGQLNYVLSIWHQRHQKRG